MDDIKELSKEITDIGAHISDMLLAWCKEKGHNPNFIFNIVGQGLCYFQKNANFSEYKATYGGLIRQMDNESLAERMFELVEQIKALGFDDAESIKGLTEILNETYEDYSKV